MVTKDRTQSRRGKVQDLGWLRGKKPKGTAYKSAVELCKYIGVLRLQYKSWEDTQRGRRTRETQGGKGC